LNIPIEQVNSKQGSESTADVTCPDHNTEDSSVLMATQNFCLMWGKEVYFLSLQLVVPKNYFWLNDHDVTNLFINFSSSQKVTPMDKKLSSNTYNNISY